jgi:cell division protein FtsB
MGLNRKLDEKDTEIHALKQRNEMLEKRLDNLEQMVELITDKN